jgi:predicted PilT family ATPase
MIKQNFPELIETLISKLNIDKSRTHCYKYYLAQAIANLDRYIVTDEFNPPMVDDKFTFAIDLKEGAIVEKCKPQTFTEVQKKFLTAKTYLLHLTDKIEPRNFNLNPGDWNSRIMLVEYKERIAASREKWGDNFLSEADKEENYAEVSTWFRLTLDLRNVIAATVPEPFPMPSTTIAKENCKESRFFCVSDLADAFFRVINKIDPK